MKVEVTVGSNVRAPKADYSVRRVGRSNGIGITAFIPDTGGSVSGEGESRYRERGSGR